MPNVHGIEFKANQSELVKDIARELLKDGNSAVYAVLHIKPNGEIANGFDTTDSRTEAPARRFSAHPPRRK